MPKGSRGRKKGKGKDWDWKLPLVWFLFLVVFIQALIIRALWVERIKSRKKVSRIVIQKEEKKKTLPKKKPKSYPFVTRPVVREEKGKSKPFMVIVLDDWGYSTRNFPLLEALSLPVDVSVFPSHEFTKDVVRLARSTRKEVMVHLPMEPESLPREKWEKDTITVEMPDEEIRRKVRQALESVEGAVGVNNHMGSKATADPRVMRIVLEELQKRGLFFLDSVSMPNSVVCKVSKEMGLPCLKRDFFIDNEARESYIVDQLKRAVSAAEEKGYVVVIGHDRPATLRALIEMETYLRERVRVIPASRLWRRLLRDDK